MAMQTGGDSVVAAKVTTTFGTAASVGSGDKWELESYQQSTNPEELTANPIGSGAFMTTDSQQGAVSPSINTEFLEHYNDAGVAMKALFYGGESVMVMAGGYYSHSLYHNETLFNNKLATIVNQYAAGSVMEFVSAVPTRLQRTWAQPPNYCRGSMDFLADQRKVTGTTNSYATLEATTKADATRVILRPNDSFFLNLMTDSALSSTHRIDVTSVTSEAIKGHSHIAEIRGSAGNGRAIPTGTPPYEETLTVTFKSLDDYTYFSGSAAGTEYKARLSISHPTLTYSDIISWPRLKLIQDPQYNLSSPAVNPLTLVFKCLYVDQSLSVPAGMLDRYPYEIVTNTKSTAYLA